MQRLTTLTVAAVLALGVLAACDSGGDGPEAPPPPTSAAEPSTTTTATPAGLTAERAVALARREAGPRPLARVVRAAERAIRTGGAGRDLPRWAEAQQVAYRALARHPEWDATVAAAVPDRLQPAVDANVLAFRELWALTEPRDALPDWRIVAPPPRRELLAHYRAAEAASGVQWPYLAAIHLVESRLGRIRGLSTAGAEGPMQFLPSTWEAYGEGDINDPGDAIAAAARYLVAHGAPDDMDRALFAYNHSNRYVTAVKAYAAVMTAEPRAFDGYYHWDVYYRLETGDVVLPVGWRAGDPPEQAIGAEVAA